MSAQIVLLCEDLQLATFMRRFLKCRGFRAHDIREEIAPAGQGSGEQWVRERYPEELAAVRSRPGKIALMVGTDADTMTVAERIATLDQACQRRGIPVRSADEPVVMVVPKRNIETWFAYLRQESPNESVCYPRYTNESDCRDDVRTLDRLCKSRTLFASVLPSLQASCVEFGSRFAR